MYENLDRFKEQKNYFSRDIEEAVDQADILAYIADDIDNNWWEYRGWAFLCGTTDKVCNNSLDEETLQWLEDCLGNEKVIEDFGRDWYRKYAVAGLYDKYGDHFDPGFIGEESLNDILPLRIERRKMPLFKAMYPELYVYLEDRFDADIEKMGGKMFYFYYDSKAKIVNYNGEDYFERYNLKGELKRFKYPKGFFGIMDK